MIHDLEPSEPALRAIIDSHQHFWRADPVRHSWLPVGNRVLFQDYEPDRLAPVLRAHGVAQTVAVQASPNAADTDALIAIAGDHDWIGGVVGWVDPHAPDCGERLATLAATPKFRGIRPNIRRRPNEQWRPDRAELASLAQCAELGLSVDVLVHHHQLQTMADVAADLPGVSMIVDHAGAPAKGDAFQDWCRDIRALSQNPGIYCKFSGLATLGEHVDQAFITRVAEILLESFGPQRIAWGSDWPILLQASDYSDWIARAIDTLDTLGGNATVQAVMRDTARTIYRLEPCAADVP